MASGTSNLNEAARGTQLWAKVRTIAVVQTSMVSRFYGLLPPERAFGVTQPVCGIRGAYLRYTEAPATRCLEVPDGPVR